MLNRIITLVAVCALSALSALAQWTVDSLPPDAVMPRWQGVVPQLVHPDTALVQLYDRAWATASARVRRGPEGMVASPYLDENCYDDQIWIWDGCFMTMFSKYAPSAFPGRETLMNYYAPLHDGAPSPLRIHLRDNPPLFAWVEREYEAFTGDTARLDYLERHYDYFNSLQSGQRDPAISPNPIFLDVKRDSLGRAEGYVWWPNASGMDNTPRGRDCGGYRGILWVDAICQQALAAENIAALHRKRGNEAKAERWQQEYDRLKRIVNDRYWDERDGFYYDIDTLTGAPCRVMTVASYWAMLAGIPDSTRAARMVEKLRNPSQMGGERPWPSLSRQDPDYDAAMDGNYWRGGVWLPMVYMGTKALERYGYHELADTLAARVVRMQARMLRDYEPHTIWETYSPEADRPSTEHGHVVRQEFCGWSALGPISLMIENVLGIRSADAATRTVHWHINPANGRHGIRHLRFGPVDCTLLYDPDTDSVTVDSNLPINLITTK